MTSVRCGAEGREATCRGFIWGSGRYFRIPLLRSLRQRERACLNVVRNHLLQIESKDLAVPLDLACIDESGSHV